jgi:hypothetical protein
MSVSGRSFAEPVAEDGDIPGILPHGGFDDAGQPVKRGMHRGALDPHAPHKHVVVAGQAHVEAYLHDPSPSLTA